MRGAVRGALVTQSRSDPAAQKDILSHNAQIFGDQGMGSRSGVLLRRKKPSLLFFGTLNGSKKVVQKILASVFAVKKLSFFRSAPQKEKKSSIFYFGARFFRKKVVQTFLEPNFCRSRVVFFIF
jgi:hypothetical protein